MAPPTEPALVDVDADGDLILRVGAEFKDDKASKKKKDGDTNTQATQNKARASEPSKIIRIRVSSKLMTMCSSFFKAMLTGRFREGQIALSATDPPTIDLPEDDPDAVLALCQVLHYKEESYEAQSFPHILKVALLSDKYDCGRAVKPWFSHQLLEKRRSGEALSGCDLGQALSAAYLLNDDQSFLEFSATAIHFLPQDVDGTPFGTAILPCLQEELLSSHKSLCNDHMVDFGDALRSALELAIDDGKEVSSNGTVKSCNYKGHTIRYGSPCRARATQTGVFVSNLLMAQLWPERWHRTSKRSFRAAKALAISLAKEIDKDSDLRCNEAHNCGGSEHSCEKFLEDAFEEELIVPGLCLQCVKSSFTSNFVATRRCEDHERSTCLQAVDELWKFEVDVNHV
ncbi:hypothetical protein H2200_001157 [Cladophialophora chaetospira]|uniref:BTB domain-containing protein n=1 Tax=Cladophialophora chaetospira TaxID=386627 RepID=A0AA39CMT1_9EURO|nr:hypothetical protein H2200_001157 [Cladophialophora chaetospira]